MTRTNGYRAHFAQKRTRMQLFRLEDRLQPSVVNYSPPSNFKWNLNHDIVSARLEQQPLDIALTYLKANAEEFNATLADFNNPKVTSQYTDVDTGLTHVYLRQTVNGLEVANADLNVTIAANGTVFSAAGGFVRDLKNILSQQSITVTPMSAMEALRSAAVNLDLPLSEEPTEVNLVYGPVNVQSFSAPGLSTDDVTARLHYVPTADGSAVVAWDLVINTVDGEHWYNLSIDAVTGNIVFLSDWVDHDSYRAIQLPGESVQDGGFLVAGNPANANASPFGWHDTNGAAGAEFTDTRGNNVDAHLDRDGNNTADASPPRPAGGAGLDFSSYTFDPASAPSVLTNQNSAVVNLFYLNNIIHDIQYVYGFTEAAGNFQVNNYGKGGLGNDAVQANAQDNANNGSTNNANFGTPVDGSAPRMQMYEFTYTTPRRDSDLDNGIIIHEYAHGVSNRLTGGPANSNALNNVQSGGMGEGWGDFYGLMFTQTAADLQNAAFGIGTYALGQAQSGVGIRRFRYSYDMAINPLTWDAYGSGGTTSYGVTRSTQVHNSGEIWSSTLWDLNWLLINKYGFDPNLYTGWSNTSGASKAGNKLTLKLVMDAMKLQPANPSFTQARDAIIAADIALNGGADLYEIWSAFARRGLGQGSSTPSSSSTATPTLSFTVPMFVSSVDPSYGSVIASSPSNYLVNVSSPITPGSLDASDFVVNGQTATSVAYTPGNTFATFSFASDPVSGPGPQAITIAGGAFTRNSDAAAVGAFSSIFYVDATPLTVVSTTPATGSDAALPLTMIDVNFSGAVNLASVQNSDLFISQGTVTGTSLVNSDTTVRFAVSGLTLEGPLTYFVAGGAVTDLEGNPNAAYGGNLNMDIGTVALPVPMTSRLPAGSLIYDTNQTAIISSGSDTDSFTLPVDANQTMTVLVTANTPTLQTKIEVRDQSNSVVASGMAPAAGQLLVLNSIPSGAGGTFTFAVSSAAGTSGSFKIQVLLNAALELENNGGAGNNTQGTAQNLNAAFSGLATSLGTASTAAIIGRTGAGAPFASENFESGSLPATITTYSSNSFGRIRVMAPTSTGNTSKFAVQMDSNTDSNFVLNEIIYTVDLSGVTVANLSFSYAQFSDETHSLATIFSGHVNGDGVAFSGDGNTWYTLLSAPTASTWTTATYDLVAAAAANSVPLGPNFQIKFQQYDNFTLPTDGRGYDNIAISGSEEDWNSFTAAGGERVTIAAKALTTGSINVALVDAGGMTIATGVAGPTNIDRVINSFLIPTSGTYFVKVTGGVNVDYSLVVEKNAVFDAEANNSAATAQNLNDAKGVLGFVTGTGSPDSDWFSFTMPAGQTVLRLETSTPGDGPNQFENSLNPLVQLFDSSGTTLIAAGAALPDGRNEKLMASGLMPGASYRVLISAEGSTGGEYFLGLASQSSAAAKVANVVVGDGTSQRSRVTSLTVNFDQAVTLPSNPADAFTLVRQGGGSVTLSGVAVNNPNTSVTLSFTGGSVDFDSLADGRYTLTALAAQIPNLDGDGNGTPGDDYVLVGSPANGLFRLFGDADGNATVATADFNAFRTAFGGTSSIFDFDNAGGVGTFDFGQFRARFGSSV